MRFAPDSPAGQRRRRDMRTAIRRDLPLLIASGYDSRDLQRQFAGGSARGRDVQTL